MFSALRPNGTPCNSQGWSDSATPGNVPNETPALQGRNKLSRPCRAGDIPRQLPRVTFRIRSTPPWALAFRPVGTGRRAILGWTSLALLTWLLLFGVQSQSQTKITYDQIAPLLQTRCVACHDHTTRKGGLNLESYETLLAGGKRGNPIVAGQSAASLLVKYLEGTLQPQMPLGDKLSAAEINLIKAWIDAGASNAPMAKEAVPVVASTATIPNLKPTATVNAAINSLAFRADGKMLAVGRYQQVELLNAVTNQSTAQWRGHANEVRAVAFSPDGKWLAAAGGNPGQFGEIKLWDVATGQAGKTWRGHRDNIFALAFAPDGKLLATCSYDKLIKLWDVATGTERQTLKDHTDAVFAVAFSPDGKLLASAGADRTVKLWDVASGQRLYTLSDALDAVHTIAFHPSGKMLAGAGADRSIHIWQIGATEGKRLRSLIAHEDAINVIAYAPDGKTLATSGADRALKLWDAETLVETQTCERQSDWVFGLAFSPDGKRLAVGRYDGSLAFYDPLTGKKK